jgi:hypothetical protein
VVGVPGYGFIGPGSIPGATRFFWEVVRMSRGVDIIISPAGGLLEYPNLKYVAPSVDVVQNIQTTEIKVF